MAIIKDAINASPTKQFFIYMLTRDVLLDQALIDLLDNSVDGAKANFDSQFNGLQVRVNYDKNEITIKDNCGGFSLSVAKNYAFKFGSNNTNYIEKSVGRFGVGMKRTLFKLGKKFEVESKHKNDHFMVEVDVEHWLKKPDKWSFSYTDLTSANSKKSKLKDDGTFIRVSKLYKGVANDFSSNEFTSNFKRSISKSLANNLLDGFEVLVNNKPVNAREVRMNLSKNLKPLKISKKLKNVSVTVLSGIGSYSPTEAGWYIYCNDRLVLDADRSYITGWKETKEDLNNVIKYHNDYAMFRGVVLFESPNSVNLPMTTTKIGIDSDHEVFKATRPIILSALKAVTHFLKKIENKEEGMQILDNSESKSISEILDSKLKLTQKFTFPTTKKIKQSNKFIRISYNKEREIVERVMENLGASNGKEVGEATFEYFINSNTI